MRAKRIELFKQFLPTAMSNLPANVRQGESPIYWYDPQPHPADVTLTLNHPHHKHIHPDIKHHRIPAPELSFDQPNLPFLVEEIVENLLK
jgi:hypothetical protein